MFPAWGYWKAPLLRRHTKGIGCRDMSVLLCNTCWVESQEPQNRFYEPVVGGYRHGRRLVAKPSVYLTLPLSGWRECRAW